MKYVNSLRFELKTTGYLYAYGTTYWAIFLPDLPIISLYSMRASSINSTYLDLSSGIFPRFSGISYPYAYKYPVVFSSNLNELTYFIELRSNQQVHPDLRKVALDIYSEIKKIHPHLATLIKFVDTGDYRLGRLPSEVKKESRRKTLSGEND